MCVLAVKKILSSPTQGGSQLSIQNDASNIGGCLEPGERIIPSRGRAWRALTFKVFNGLCSTVTSLRLAKELVSRRAAEEPRCFLLWIQMHFGSQHICKARSAASRCNTLLIGVLEITPSELQGRHHRTEFHHNQMQEGKRWCPK